MDKIGGLKDLKLLVVSQTRPVFIAHTHTYTHTNIVCCTPYVYDGLSVLLRTLFLVKRLNGYQYGPSKGSLHPILPLGENDPTHEITETKQCLI